METARTGTSSITLPPLNTTFPTTCEPVNLPVGVKLPPVSLVLGRGESSRWKAEGQEHRGAGKRSSELPCLCFLKANPFGRSGWLQVDPTLHGTPETQPFLSLDQARVRKHLTPSSPCLHLNPSPPVRLCRGGGGGVVVEEKPQVDSVYSVSLF